MKLTDIQKKYLRLRHIALVNNISTVRTDKIELLINEDIDIEKEIEKDNEFISNVTQKDIKELKQIVMYNRDRNISNVQKNNLKQYNTFVDKFFNNDLSFYMYENYDEAYIINFKYVPMITLEI